MDLIGQYAELPVEDIAPMGVYLKAPGGENILLPKKYIPGHIEKGETIKVFIYTDSEDRVIATTLQPYAIAGEVASLKVVDINDYGAFMDLGIAKDLFVPYREQKLKMEPGKFYIVYVYLDEESMRLAGSTRLERYIDQVEHNYKAGDEVSIIITRKTDRGYSAIINNKHWGLLYENELFKNIRVGKKYTGYIKKVREDRKIDLTLEKPGYAAVDPASEKILEVLKKHNGSINVTDNSPPEIIYQKFQMSKKLFKKAVGKLYKERRITLNDYHIELNE